MGYMTESPPKGLSDAPLIAYAFRGGGAPTMPAVGNDVLPDSSLQDVIAFLETLQ